MRLNSTLQNIKSWSTKNCLLERSSLRISKPRTKISPGRTALCSTPSWRVNIHIYWTSQTHSSPSSLSKYCYLCELFNKRSLILGSNRFREDQGILCGIRGQGSGRTAQIQSRSAENHRFGCGRFESPVQSSILHCEEHQSQSTGHFHIPFFILSIPYKGSSSWLLTVTPSWRPIGFLVFHTHFLNFPLLSPQKWAWNTKGRSIDSLPLRQT